MTKNKKSQDFTPFCLLVILPFLAIVISSFAIVQGIKNYVTTSNYFRIRELRVEGIADRRYLDLMKEEILGVNIFRLDVGKLAERIKNRFPTFYSVTINRVLPSELFIAAKERLPVAIVKRDLYYLLDADGMVLASFSSGDASAFPLIIGLENQLPRFKLGVGYSTPALRKSLVLAKTLRLQSREIEASFSPFQKRRVTKIDASVPNQLSFYLGDDVQIRVGDSDFDNKIDLMPMILHSIGADLGNVRYIDLRPKEPVVAMKDEKKKNR